MMIIRQTSLLTSFALIAIIIAFHSCQSKSQPTDPTLDGLLYAEISSPAGYTYYQGGNILTAASPSPHGSFKLRMNATAVAALDGTGELPSGGSFPVGSVIVKEVHVSGSLSMYAVIKKDPSSPNAGSGWVWAEYNLNGLSTHSTTLRGEGCVSCHSESPNRDRVRTFDLH